MRKWQKAIEAYIGNNRYRIIVDASNYLNAKKLQQRVRYGSRVSLPKSGREIPKRKDVSFPSIRSAISVIRINPRTLESSSLILTNS
jgi:chromosome segregation protein